MKGINEESKQQCIKLTGSNTCSLVIIDEYCSINETDKTCKQRKTLDEEQYTCVNNSLNTQCIRKTKCSTRNTCSCRVNDDNCIK